MAAWLAGAAEPVARLARGKAGEEAAAAAPTTEAEADPWSTRGADPWAQPAAAPRAPTKLQPRPLAPATAPAQAPAHNARVAPSAVLEATGTGTAAGIGVAATGSGDDGFGSRAEAVLAALLAGEFGPSGNFTFESGLTPPQRRYVHQAAQRRGLLSASSGDGAGRRLTVYLPGAAGAPLGGPPAMKAQQSPAERLSRYLSSLLRHNAREEGLALGSDGYARVGDVAALASFHAGGFTVSEVRKLVGQEDEKRRFSICERGGEMWIRANQGHTMASVQDDKLLKPISSAAEVPDCVHGTFLSAWPKILASGGLSHMARNHIHFTTQLPGPGNKVISGMRQDAEVAVFVSVASALAAGLEFFRSANGVILTRGDARGMLPVAHFLRAVRLKDGSQLWPDVAGASAIGAAASDAAALAGAASPTGSRAAAITPEATSIAAFGAAAATPPRQCYRLAPEDADSDEELLLQYPIFG